MRTVRYGQRPASHKQHLKKHSGDEVHARCAKRPDLRRATIAKGAQDHGRFLEKAFPQAEPILDVFHAAENLKKIIDHVYGKNSEQGLTRWQGLRHVLRTDPQGGDKVMTSLRHITGEYNLPESTFGSFTRNRERMKYSHYRDQNLMIGRGIVDATNKVLVSQRLKGAGMAWSCSGGQAILSLKALVLSDRFDAAWKILAPHWQRYQN